MAICLTTFTDSSKKDKLRGARNTKTPPPSPTDKSAPTDSRSSGKQQQLMVAGGQEQQHLCIDNYKHSQQNGRMSI